MKLIFVSKGAKQGFEIGRFVNVFLSPDDQGKLVPFCVFRCKSGVWTLTDATKALIFSSREYRIILGALHEQGKAKDIEFVLAIPPEI